MIRLIPLLLALSAPAEVVDAPEPKGLPASLETVWRAYEETLDGVSETVGDLARCVVRPGLDVLFVTFGPAGDVASLEVFGADGSRASAPVSCTAAFGRLRLPTPPGAVVGVPLRPGYSDFGDPVPVISTSHDARPAAERPSFGAGWGVSARLFGTPSPVQLDVVAAALTTHALRRALDESGCTRPASDRSWHARVSVELGRPRLVTTTGLSCVDAAIVGLDLPPAIEDVSLDLRFRAPSWTELVRPVDPSSLFGRRLGRYHRNLRECLPDRYGLSASLRVDMQLASSGGVEALTIRDSDLPSSTESCVRSVLEHIEFPPFGRPTSWNDIVVKLQ